LTLLAVIYYPIKRLLKKRKKMSKDKIKDEDENVSGNPE